MPNNGYILFIDAGKRFDFGVANPNGLLLKGVNTLDRESLASICMGYP